MPDPNSPAELVPSGQLVTLTTKDVIPSKTNPRRLFDPDQLEELKKSIREHGVLVPITVYRPKGQRKYSILDGERRYRCCVQLEDDGHQVSIPANVVSPPSKVAGLLYMFSIHNFREAWELMPTALALRSVMEALHEDDTQRLVKLTGLSEKQVERCKTLLEYPEKYQLLSLDPDPKTRIPSNFWIELKPVLDLAERELPDLAKKMQRNGISDAMVDKYRAKKIKSVIHFRRIMEAYEVAEERQANVIERLRRYISETDLETRAAFDEFVVDNRRIQGAIEACREFIRNLQRRKLDFAVDRDELRVALREVVAYAQRLLAKLEGGDAPTDEATETGK